MKFTATIAPRCLKPLGSNDDIEAKVMCVVKEALLTYTPEENQEGNFRVELVEICTIEIELDLNLRDAETVKDILYEALMVYFDPDYNSDIELEIDNEM
jgi:hypothetical protein